MQTNILAQIIGYGDPAIRSILVRPTEHLKKSQIRSKMKVVKELMKIE